MDTEKNKKVYMDLLNFSSKFYSSCDWNSKIALSKVEYFAYTALNSNYIVKCFIDDTTPTEETQAKWKSRREREILNGSRRTPLSLGLLLGDMFRKVGIEVVFSNEMDNDDTLAFHAEADRACILSNDKDFFRYIDSTFVVYGDYYIKNNKLILVEKSKDIKNKSSKRKLEMPPTIRIESSNFQIIDNKITYKRGSGSPLMKKLNMSPHAIVAPLRHALFYYKNISYPVIEIWPEWSQIENRVVWHIEEIIAKENEYIRLLDKPNEAMMYFFPLEAKNMKPKMVNLKDWRKHIHCLRTIIYEICSKANNKKSLLDYWIEFENLKNTLKE